MTIKQTLMPILCLALLAACGKQESASTAAVPAAPAPSAEPTAAPPPPAAAEPAAVSTAEPASASATDANALAVGEGVYKKTCFLCHGTGAGGAPLLTDSAEWASRQAKGTDVLYQHAIAGFTGDKGMMPPKGANLALSDDEVKASVDYMLSQVK